MADWAVDLIATASSLVPPVLGLLVLSPDGFGLTGLTLLLLMFATTIPLIVWVTVSDVAGWVDGYWLGISPVVVIGCAANVVVGAIAVALTR